VTFKDLQKAIESQAERVDANINLRAKLQGKPFWIFDKEQHRQEGIRTKDNCCFWHVIGLRQKDGHDMPVLPYQRTLYDSLQTHKHIWIKLQAVSIDKTSISIFVNSGNRGIKKGNGGCMDAPAPVCFCLSPLSQTYDIHLSSITIISYNIPLYEDG
jgi:hypothetical protein